MLSNTDAKNNPSLPVIFLSPSQERSGGGSSNTPLIPQKIDGKWQLATVSPESLTLSELVQSDSTDPIDKKCKVWIDNWNQNWNNNCSQFLSDDFRFDNLLTKLCLFLLRKDCRAGMLLIRSRLFREREFPDCAIDIGIDYLMGVLRRLHPNKANSFISYVSQAFDCELDFKERFKHHGCYEFNYVYECPMSGLKIYYEMNDDTTVTLAFVAPGKSLRPLAISQIFDFIVRARSVYNCDFTLIDICVDDYKKRSSFKQLNNLAKKGDVAGAKNRLYIDGGVVGDRGIEQAETMYLGSKRQVLRIYNAEFLHGIPAYRWEGRFREDRCRTIINFILQHYQDFVENPEEQLAFILKFLGNKVMAISKFVHRKGDKKQAITRFRRYAFYESILKDIGEIDPKLLKNEPKPKLNSYEFVLKSFDWLNRQVFKRLALLEESFGFNFGNLFDDCLQSARDRYSNADDIRQRAINDFIKDIPQHNLKEFTKQLVPA